MEEKKEREGEAESLSPETPQTGRLRGRSRKRAGAPEGKKRAGRIALAAVIGTAALAAAGAGYYFLETGKYKTAFFPNTTINGIDASEKTVEEVKSLIEAGLSGNLIHNSFHPVIAGPLEPRRSAFIQSLTAVWKSSWRHRSRASGSGI